MNIQAIANKISELGIEAKTDADIVNELKALPSEIDSITFRQAFNLNIDHGVGLAIQEILADIDAQPIDKYYASIMHSVMTVKGLDPISINDETTQKVFTGLVSFKGATNNFTQSMRDIIEDAARKPTGFEEVTIEHVALARLVGEQQATSVTYPENAEYFTKKTHKQVKVFVYLDAPAPKNIRFDVYALQRSGVDKPFVNNGVRCGYMQIDEGELGQYVVLNQSFTEHVQFRVVSDTKVPFTVDIVEA